MITEARCTGAIRSLLRYGRECGLMDGADETYCLNTYLRIFSMDAPADEPGPESGAEVFPDCLETLCDFAAERGIIENTKARRDLFDTLLMDVMTPRPSEVIREFRRLYEVSPEEATDYFYKLSRDSNYIRRDRIAKDIHWTAEGKYGTLELSINLSKPEKDPRDIAVAKTAKASGYPKCLLCAENEGYAGTLTHPARENHRIIPLSIQGEKWGLQYSPYVYYNEHCIVLNTEHVPMSINDTTFGKLFDFVRQFPHYFVGSNADLPIVGGSILSHEHFQGGRHSFPMELAETEFSFTVPGFPGVSCSVLHYPMSVIRLDGGDSSEVSELASRILTKWRGYTDEAAFIFAETDGEKHNTITPIARMREGKYELDLVLRNNITTEECPLGLYHPHAALHHIKKENIGLIEVMGLAILPGRLKTELQVLREAMLRGSDLRADGVTEKHADWAEEILRSHPEFDGENAGGILKEEVGRVFEKVLEDAGVYKCTEEGREAFRRFIAVL